MDIAVLYEDDCMLVINKPAGVVVNRSESAKDQTVQDWVERLEYWPHVSLMTDEFTSRSGIVHRIDKETSGLLLVAKTVDAFSELQRQFKERLVQKTYVTIVHGILEGAGEITAPVGRLPWNRERFGIVSEGKEARSSYVSKRVGTLQVGKDRIQCSVIDVSPHTGRTHQIRVHMKYIGHPIVGDYLYAGRKTARGDRLLVSRVMLHARTIECLHPRTNERLVLEAPIPDDMNSIFHQIIS